MALSTQAEGLDTENQLLGSKGVEGSAQVTEGLHTGTDDEGDGAKGVPELEAVVAVRGLDELGEAFAVLAPVELARVDNDTANGGAVAANPLGGGVDDNVGAVVDGTDKVTSSTKGVVDDQGDALVVSDLGNSLKVGHVVARVTDALDVDGLGLVVNGGGNVLGLVAVDKLGGDAQAREEHLELVVGAAVEVGRGDNVVAGLGNSGNGDELRCLARRGGKGSNSSLESGDALLKDVVGGLFARC